MPRARLDTLLIARGLAESREKAKRLIMAGQVTVNGQVVFKPGAQVPAESEVSVRDHLPYVSRGGLKLQRALQFFGINVNGKIVADIGASAGGFTDCLLQHGAVRVYAIDVGYGQLAWSLRQDDRVVVMERTNIRYLQGLPELVDLATVDVSFISLTLVLPVVRKLLKPGGEIIALIKPQFEAGREQVGKGGVIKEPTIHRSVLRQIVDWCRGQGLYARGLVPSPLKGPAGNIEFFVHLCQNGGCAVEDSEKLLDHCLSIVSSEVQ